MLLKIFRSSTLVFFVCFCLFVFHTSIFLNLVHPICKHGREIVIGHRRYFNDNEEDDGNGSDHDNAGKEEDPVQHGG